jgi:hypothetical protein
VKFQEVRLSNVALRWPVEVVSPQGWIVRLQNGSDVQQLPSTVAGAAMLNVSGTTRVLPAAKITEIKAFTPAAWAKGKGKEIRLKEPAQSGRAAATGRWQRHRNKAATCWST